MSWVVASQNELVTKAAASTWGATLNKARQVYTAVARPAMTYGAAVWYSPREIRERGTGQVAKLKTLQNKCLRSMTGAFKATNTRLPEAESGVTPLDIHLDQTVLKSREAHRCSEVINLAKARIRSKLRGKGGRKSKSGITPCRLKRHGPKTAWIS